VAQTVSFNGVVYTVPSVGDDSWGQNLTDYLIAIPQGALQKSGGIFTLSADLNFGANYGILSRYFSTREPFPAQSGVVRLSLSDVIAWRNNAQDNDLVLGLDLNDQLTFNGTPLQPEGDYITELTGDVTALGPGQALATIANEAVTNEKLRPSVALSVLGNPTNLDGTVNDIVSLANGGVLNQKDDALTFSLLANANIDPNAAIEYTKLSLSASITNLDLSDAANINYSKLNLANSILDSDIGESAAIAYTKLALGGAIQGSDIAADAAIELAKLAGLTIGRVLVSDEVGVISPSVVTTDELSHLSGVTSNIQTQLDSKMSGTDPTFTGPITTQLPANRAVTTNAASELSESPVTDTELSHLSGVTSALQTQLDAKLESPVTAPGDMIYSPDGTTISPLPIGSSGQVLKVLGGEPIWSSFSGGINYASSNPDAEADTAGWTTYTNTAANVPVNGIGEASTALTLSRTTTDPLRDTASFLMTQADGSNAQGQGVSFDFTIDPADQAKPLSITFDYNASDTFVASDGSTIPLNDGSTTVTAGNSDLSVHIYDVTNDVLIPITPNQFSGNGLNNYSFKGTFQTSADSLDYRLILHGTRSSTSTPGYRFKFDNVYIGPQSVSYGSPITDEKEYAPTITGTSSNPTKGTIVRDRAYWRRSGDSIEIRYEFMQSTAGAAGSGFYSFSLPPGLKFDINKLVAKSGNAETTLGTGTVYNANALMAQCIIQAVDANTWTLAYGTGANRIGSAAYSLNTANTSYAATFRAPIQGWSSSLEMSSDADTRLISLVVTGDPLPVTTSAWKTVIYGKILTDTSGSYDITTGKYKIPISGMYIIGLIYSANTVNCTFYCYKNNIYLSYIASVGYKGGNSILAYFTAGDIVDIRVDMATSFYADNRMWIHRLSGGSAISASETAAARYSTSSGQSIPQASGTIINFDNKEYDTHGAATIGTNWKYTAPISGTYNINALVSYDNVTASGGQTFSIDIYKNGLLYCTLWTQPGSGSAQYYRTGGSTSIKLNAGDSFYVRVYQNTGTAINLYANITHNYLDIYRIGS
jgi:hypothetical protein